MNINVDVRVSHWTSNVEPHEGVTIEVTDMASHKRVATVTLTPLDFYNIMANRGGKGTAEILDPEHYQYVGKKHVHQEVDLDKKIVDTFRWEPKVTQEMRDIGELYVGRLDMEGYRWTRHNYGWGLRVWKYE